MMPTTSAHVHAEAANFNPAPRHDRRQRDTRATVTHRYDPLQSALERIETMRAQAEEEGRISTVYAAIHEIIFSEFVRYKNGDLGVRNVLHDDRIIELLRHRHGLTISKDTLTRAKKKLGRVLGFRWDRTPAGCTYRMHADGTMSGKYPAKCDIDCDANPQGRCGLRKTITKKIAANETEVSSKTVHSGRTGTRPPPRDRVAGKLAALASWVPSAADIEFGTRLRLTEREIEAEAGRMRAWYVHPDHPWRRERVPADPSAKFREWLERGATKKAIRKAEKEAAELRRQAMEDDLRAAEIMRAGAAQRLREAVRGDDEAEANDEGKCLAADGRDPGMPDEDADDLKPYAFDADDDLDGEFFDSAGLDAARKVPRSIRHRPPACDRLRASAPRMQQSMFGSWLPPSRRSAWTTADDDVPF